MGGINFDGGGGGGGRGSKKIIGWEERPLIPPSYYGKPCLSAGGMSLQPNFQKLEAWQNLNLKGCCWERGLLFSGRLQFPHQNKLKSEIFNDKKSL